MTAGCSLAEHGVDTGGDIHIACMVRKLHQTWGHVNGLRLHHTWTGGGCEGHAVDNSNWPSYSVAQLGQLAPAAGTPM